MSRVHEAISVQYGHYIPNQTNIHRAIPSQELELTMIKAQFKPLLDSLNQQHFCVSCNQSYLPKDNYLGRFCFYHPQSLGMHGVWKCCGDSRESTGCVPCIHINNKTKILELKQNPAMVLNVPIVLIKHNLVYVSPLVFSQYNTLDALPDCVQMFFAQQPEPWRPF